MFSTLKKMGPRIRSISQDKQDPMIAKIQISHAEIQSLAESCEKEGDWHNARKNWQELYSTTPENRRAVIGLVNALIQMQEFSEAEKIIHTNNDKFSSELDFLINAALCAQYAGKYTLAINRFDAAKRHSPEFAFSFAASAAMHASAGEKAKSESEIAEALVRFPKDVDIVANSIQISIINENWVMASERLQYLNENFADHQYTQKMHAALKESVTYRLQLEAQRASEEALLEEKSENWQAAIVAWKRCLEYDPKSKLGLLFIANCYANINEYELADQALSTALSIYPDTYEVRARHAALPGRFNLWHEAAARWHINILNYPDMLEYADMAAFALEKSGDTEFATSILSKAADTYPERIDLRMLHAKSAEKEKKWVDAIESWDIVIDSNPQDINAKNARGEAFWHAGFQDLAANSADRDNVVISTEQTDTETQQFIKIAEQFESLGDNCEFGFVQRLLGAEPLGLLRFTAITPVDLLDFLHSKFSDFGNHGSLEIIRTNTEVMLQDTKNRFSFHTFVKSEGLDESRFLFQQHKRLDFLKREILHDLSTGSKIFVCKNSHEAISDSTLVQISDALQSYGPNYLLGIRLADETNEPGSILLLNEFTMVGFVSYIFRKIPDSMDQIDMDSWKKILPLALKNQHNSRTLSTAEQRK